MKEKTRKVIFAILVAICFVTVLIYNVLTPQMSDELQFDSSLYHSFWDLVKVVYNSYMTWNGRSVVQLIMNCFLMTPKWFFNIMNSICFVVLTLLMYANIEGRKKYDGVIYLLIILSVWQFGVEFGQTVLWESGACNYLWGATIITGFITFYRYKLRNVNKVSHKRILIPVMFAFGILAGWCNENTSGGGLLIVLCILGLYIYNKGKLSAWIISGPLGVFVGLVIMVIAPGNKIRTASVMEEESQTGIMALVSRFLNINEAIENYLLLILAVVIILAVYLILKGHKIMDMSNAIIYAVASIATAYALIMTVTPMDRAYFGASIFMIIACVQMVAYIPDNETGLQAIKYGGIITFTIFMFISYCDNGADLVRIRREVNERNSYIVEQMEQGNYDLTVPMLRPQFDTKYSFMYANDIDEDPESWGCQILKNYYGLDNLVGVPREDWTEY